MFLHLLSFPAEDRLEAVKITLRAAAPTLSLTPFHEGE